MNRNRFFVIVLGLMALAGGCKKQEASTPTGGTGAAGPRKIVIGIIAKSSSNEVFQAAHVGAQDAAKTLGPKFGAEVTIDIRTPTDENVQKQAEAIEALTRAGVNGIAIACSEGKTVEQPINAAVDAGVPVVCFDYDSPGS